MVRSSFETLPISLSVFPNLPKSKKLLGIKFYAHNTTSEELCIFFVDTLNQMILYPLSGSLVSHQLL